MIVYVESNFLLEIAYLQEEHASCEAILELATDGGIRLRVPAFAIVEARMSHARQTKGRAEFHERLTRQIRELARSKPYSDVPARSRELISALIDGVEDERRRLDNGIDHLFRDGQILPTTADVLARASEDERELGLSPQDAVVYASVVVDIEASASVGKCFLNRNSKDFANPDIYAELGRGNCKLFTSFEDGLGYIRHALNRA